MTLVLGVDGGGSRTRAALFRIADNTELQLVATGDAEGSNPYSVGWDASQAAISSAVEAAGKPADAKPDLVVLAVAGCGSDAARERLADWARQREFAIVAQVVPDTEPVLAAAPVGEAAIGLIAGTGSAALARRACGSMEIVGGWGYLIDDAGSGYALGRDALRRLTQLTDAGAALDALSGEVLRHADVERPADIKSQLYSSESQRAWIAAIAPTVVRLSEAGDAIARRIASDNADALAKLALDAASRAADVPSDRPCVYLAGGLATGSDHYRNLIEDALAASGWERGQVRDAVDGATGCAMLAARRLAEGHT